jgi:hypothetical protein
MKRVLAFAVALLLLAGTAFGWPLARVWKGGGAAWWNDSSLTFYAPFTDPANPLALTKGTGTLSFTRATTATYVHPTTGLITEAASGALRIESNGALIEGQRTNLALQSEALGLSSAWTKVNVTVDNNTILAPDGTMTAEKITETTASGPHDISKAKTLDDATTYTHSVFAKAAERTWIWLNLFDDVDGTRAAFFNLSNGTIGTVEAGVTATMVSYGNGWYRCSASKTTSSTSALVAVYLSTSDGVKTYVGDDTAGVYLWGYQLEEASFPSTYIGPTTTASVTRNLDSASAASSGNIDNTAGTLATKWTPSFDSTMTTGAAYYLFDAGGLEAYYNATDQKIYLTDGANTISTAALTFSANVAKDLAFTWGDGLSITVDGTDTTGATYTEFAPGASTFFGADTTPANLLYGNLESTRIWNRQFSVTERTAIAP